MRRLVEVRWRKIVAIVVGVPTLAFAALVVVGLVMGGGTSSETAAPTASATTPPHVARSPATPTPFGGGLATASRGPSGDSGSTAPPGPRTSTPAPSRSTSPAPLTSATPRLWPVVGITDGDTIRVRVDGRTERVRVIGIDTPELDGRQCFAREAASAMQSLAQSRSVALEADPTQADRDRYGRLLRHVVLPDGRLAAQVLIAGGYGREYTYAADYRHQSAFRSAQAQARGAARGIWSPECAARVAAAPSPSPAPKKLAEVPAGRCDIKGNISRDGERIYHVPGGRSYDKTVISTGKGERWFCSEAEATAAGWRAARG